MQKGGRQKLDALVQEMSHYDPDNMEMAAKRLSEMIIAGEVNLQSDQKVSNIVRQAYMKQIQSENDTVQSEAIKYLADIVPKLPSDQVEIIFERILEFIINPNLQEKKRERYGACAATVIHQAAEENGHKLQNLFLKSIIRLLQFKDKKSQVEIILINIITEFIKKWPTVASKLKYDRKSLIIYLLKNVQTKSKLDIIKKSENCLGKLSIILDRQMVNLMLNEQDWGLLKFIQKHNGKPTIENLKNLRNGLLCLTQIIRTHNVQLRYWIKNVALLVSSVICNFKASEEIDNIETICDILDAALTALSYTLKAFNKELKDLLETPQNPFNQFVLELLNFNVEGMMSYAGQPMGIEQDYQENQQYYEQAEVDEKCWKVRRSCLFYISFLAKYDKNFLNRLGEGDLVEDLGNKLVQQHTMVSQMAFTTFNTLIQLISIDRALTNDDVAIEELSLQRVKSSALSIADNLIKQISKRVKIILNNSKFNDQLKIQSSKILMRVIQIYNHILVSNQHETFQLINFLIEEIKKTTIIENKCNLLVCLRELISNEHSFAAYQNVYDLLFDQITKNNNIKIQNNCINGLRKFTDQFAAEVSSIPKYLKMLISLLKDKIGQFDSDKSIKQSVSKCIASVFAKISISQEDTVYFLQMFSAKLKIEIEKLYIVQALNSLKANQIKSNEKVQIINALIKQLAQNLGSNNYELNFRSIEAINLFLHIIQGKFTQKNIQQLLEKSKLLLVQGKVPIFFRLIVDTNPKLLKPYAQLIVKSTQCYYTEKLIKNSVIDTEAVIKILSGLDHNEKGKKISQVIGAINYPEAKITKAIEESTWGRIMIGALGYIGNEKSLPLLFKYINQFKADEYKSEVCSAIGNIVSKNQNVLVPQIIQMGNKAKDIYTYIYIFKEMLNFNSQPFNDITRLIEWLLLKSENKFEAESNYFITSQCVGKLAFINSDAAKLVLSNEKSPNQNRRMIVANSLRFGLENNGKQDIQSLNKFIRTTVHLLGDQKYRVRDGAIKSLISVTQNHLRELKGFIDESFWKNLFFNCHINDSLIVTIDYGVCKEVRDDGRNLRLEALNLMHILTKKVHIEGNVIEEILKISLQRLREQTLNDIILKRINIIKDMCKLDYQHFVRLQDDFVRSFSVKEGVFKKYETKGLEDERAEIYVKGVLRQIYEIDKLAQAENVDRISILITELKTNNTIANVMDGLQKNGK